jgi:PIN domain nuclease of toxin-antitoxin system
MNYLLDTHTYIWFESQPEKLSPRVPEICESNEHVLYLSTASVWEMQIKIQLSKLDFPHLQARIANQLALHQLKISPITLLHTYALARLPLGERRDPFDRLLVAQALHENWPILTSDPRFIQYSIKTVWSLG